MRIKKIHLKNFKRFTDLTISELPETSRLVLLIGSNGSGKSSLFDAFDWLSKGKSKGIPYGNNSYSQDYYKKVSSQDQPTAKVELHREGVNAIEKKQWVTTSGEEFVRKFIGRSSIRIVPRISSAHDLEGVSADRDSPLSYIENDTRFLNDVLLYIQQINNALREPIFKGQQADTLKIFRDFIEPLNSSLINIFGGEENTTIQIAEFEDATPNAAAKLVFRKGESKINYDLLSHGEKQVIILLLNFIVRQEYYKDSIIFIDEMDCHLNTALQTSLLQEIVTRWIPEDAQLWTASHALGFIEYARKSEIASIVDFDLLNFDNTQELTPQPKDRLDIYEIAIPKSIIASILKGYKLVVVENKNDEFFNLALGQDGYLFLPANNNREVFFTAKSDKDKIGLRDRDYLREDEIKSIQSAMPNMRILSYSTFENYIYHPDNLNELKLAEFDINQYVTDIIRQKNARLLEIVGEIGTSRNHYVEFKDDLKGLKNDGKIQPIIDALKSDQLETFYPYYSMKNHYNKGFLNQFKYATADLARTKWFKEQILIVLK